MRVDFVRGDSALLRVYRYDDHVQGEVYALWLKDRR
jgi:hypothetical protein